MHLGVHSYLFQDKWNRVGPLPEDSSVLLIGGSYFHTSTWLALPDFRRPPFFRLPVAVRSVVHPRFSPALDVPRNTELA
jgi:hypothetical protein